MNEKLVIQNFGPIKSAEISIKKFTVLIGEQATGKSTVAKLLAVCRYFSYIVYQNIPTQRDAFEQGLISWGLSESIHNDTKIIYNCEHYQFIAERYLETSHERATDTEFVQVEYPRFNTSLTPKSKSFKRLLDDLCRLSPTKENTSTYIDFDFLDWTIPTIFYQNEVSKVLDNPFYFPTERVLQTFFSIGRNSIQNISDSLFNQFAKIYDISKRFKGAVNILPLKIEYQNRVDRGYVRKNGENEFFSLDNAATGYKSTIPIFLVIKSYLERKRSKTFIIEEPEQGLFPSAQKEIIHFFADTANIGNNRMFLTTHSPYVLASLNNLIYADKVARQYTKEVDKILTANFRIRSEDISVYKLLSNGTIDNIFDESEGLIMSEEIDSVSQDINEIFEQLLTIEYDKNSEG